MDGWTFEGCSELIAAVERAERKNEALCISVLVHEGAPEKAIKRAIIIEFGSVAAIFDALLPESYLIGGQVKKLHQLGREHL